MSLWRQRALLVLGLVLLLGGCAAGGASSDNHRRDGFYGGVSGGVTGMP